MIASIFAVLALAGAAVGLALGLVLGDPVPGVALGVGVLLGGAGSIAAVRALRPGSADGGARHGAALADAASGWAEFHRELARARRFEGHFGIVRLETAEPADPAAVERLRDEIAAAARRIDRVWIDGDHIVMLLPEATKTAAAAVLERIRSAVPEALAVEPRVAAFPADGVTSGAIIAAVYRDHHDVPTPIAAVRHEGQRPAVAEEPQIEVGDMATRSS